MTDRDYQHSRPLDVHRWSEHKEANGFVDYVYDTYLNTQSNENQRIKKRHLKVVLLDLYVAWLNDPDLNIAVHMTTGAYSDGTVFNKGKSRYNELNIKVSTIEVVHRLLEADSIGFQKGFEGSSEWQGYISRIWPNDKLTKLFEDAALGEFDIGYTDNRETIILRDEDAYDRVFDGEHRDIVKEAFNAMIQASTNLTQKPRKLDLSEVDLDWPTLKRAILDAHKPIADVFFQGHGNELQYTDSCIAERVMLQFIKSDDAPALPVHDSFIMHHTFGEELGELEEAMRRAFYEHFKKDINVKSEIGVMLPSSFDGKDSDELTIEQIVHGPPEYSQWESRN